MQIQSQHGFLQHNKSMHVNFFINQYQDNPETGKKEEGRNENLTHSFTHALCTKDRSPVALTDLTFIVAALRDLDKEN
jgi:hypothetical protein